MHRAIYTFHKHQKHKCNTIHLMAISFGLTSESGVLIMKSNCKTLQSGKEKEKKKSSKGANIPTVSNLLPISAHHEQQSTSF